MSAGIARAESVEDLRRLARKRLPLAMFDFVDGGSETETALRHNRAVFDRVRFRARTVVDVTERSQEIELFGRKSGSPFAISAMGGLGTLRYKAEVALAKAASEARIPFMLSLGANCTIEEVAEAAPQARLWAQLYTFKEDRLNRALVERAAAAGYEALVVTTDSNVFPKRERDRRNGFAFGLKKTPRNVWDVLTHPRWTMDVVLRGNVGRMESMVPLVDGPKDTHSLLAYFIKERSPALDWEALKRIRQMWKGPMILKGIMTKEEAALAADHGMDGVILSNHGGRNLDYAVAPLEILPEVMDAVGQRITVMLDSGFRRGSDVLKAIAMGAKTALFGRPAAYAVAAGGEFGARRIVSIFQEEIDKGMGFLGIRSLNELGPDFLWFDGLAAGPSIARRND
jgi:isopentenyl diphosphate isomerase/L-lactate dehydrogenase-like FMN-dependent dehydrogenase